MYYRDHVEAIYYFFVDMTTEEQMRKVTFSLPSLNRCLICSYGLYESTSLKETHYFITHS